MTQFILALFLIGIGLSVAGTGTHLYQQLARKVAAFSLQGQTALESLINVVVVVICGPYMMLRMGWQSGSAGRPATVDVLLASTIAFGWSFVTGLMIVGTYVAMLRAVA
ncbi:DUF6949 family protein [Pelagibacterium luteolum]|uniref:Uncharacterized protein n=1 Tax=Pelagibacterium luteolum TaxID=440168 RepID=A0A1G7XGM6_9HYPH|nr:hypothetical protein [Pelagibacterium luteolum]SDG83362.1 hypothetical protein SAMN04487974_109103 [Pelagibacterium luteolum]